MKRYGELISTAELAQSLGDPDLVIFDCRHDLVKAEVGRRAYLATHISGAQFMHCDDDLAGRRSGRNGRHPLPDPQSFATLLAERGVDNECQVVAYDDADGIFAARLWWMLRWLGHDDVAVLDGGFPAWIDEGHPRASGVERREPARFGYWLRRQQVVEARYVLEHLDDPSMLLVDARPPERFRGESEDLDPVAGRIPGSINRFFGENVDEEGRFKPAQRLLNEYRALLGEHAPQQVVHTCGSGVTACHNLLAMELAGLRGAKLYAGSWSEWCADPSRPVANGPG